MEMLNSCQKISIFARDGFAGIGKKRREREKGGGGVLFSDCIINWFGENWAIVLNMYKNENRYLKCVPHVGFQMFECVSWPFKCLISEEINGNVNRKTKKIDVNLTLP